MPSGQKSNKFTNRHAQEANDRKAAVAAQEKAAKKQKAEDASWVDDDKQANKKAARAAEQAAKDADAARRKAEAKAELEAEEKDLVKKPPKAVSRKEQQRAMAALVRNYDMEARLNAQSSDDADLNTRHNKAVAEAEKERESKPSKGGKKDPPSATASKKDEEEETKKGGIDEALAKERIDSRHIGKRARVAYRKFEAANLDAIRKSKPGMRRTQYSDMLWNMWQKSPENPFVQRAVQRADDALQRKWCQADEEPSDSEGEETA